MGDSTGVTPLLRWLWATAAGMLLVGLVGFWLDPTAGLFLAELGLVLAAVAGGITAARGSSVGPFWNLLAWFVPAAPVLGAMVVFAWISHERLDAMLLVLLVVFGSAAAFAVWTAFAIACVIELVRRRRRRFGEPRPAWENAPTPPPYS